MKSVKIALLAMMCVLALTAGAKPKVDVQTLRNEITNEITANVLPFWLDHAPDGCGGFYGMIGCDGEGYDNAPRGAVLCARILWTFSAAYRNFGLPEHLEMADMMQRYLLDTFVDKNYGGVYWTVDNCGLPIDASKQTYATAYAIYGLSEHYRVTGNRESLDAAIALYNTLNIKVHDPFNGGYYEIMLRDYSGKGGEGVDGSKEATKTMNSHIHLLEAFTNLYQVWPDKAVAADIRALIDILGEKLYDPATGHLILFTDDSWHPIGKIDSYGHDIETSWLLTEAAETLGDKALVDKVHKQALRMVDAAYEGVTPDGVLVYEKSEHGLNTRLSWWVQCETVIGCINAWQITGDDKYLDMAARAWQYIKDNFVDTTYGEWYHNSMPDGTMNKREPKGSIWNCPYHNSRLGFEAFRRLAPDVTHSEVMAWSNILGLRVDGELMDFESALCVGTPGADIESTGRERQNNVRYRREGPTQIVDIPVRGVRFHQEVTDIGPNSARVSIEAEADTTCNTGAYLSITLAPEHYADAKIAAKGKKVTVKSAERNIDIEFDRKVETKTLKDGDNTVLYITMMPSLKAGAKTSLNATVKASGTMHAQPVNITLDMKNPGDRFAGFGGNFRIQNPRNDPKVIDFCLDNMPVRFGRVEFPWASWDKGGASDPHVQESVAMAVRLKEIGMPVVVSCWFPPQWALAPGSVRQRGGVAALRLDPDKKQRIYDSLASYLVYLKQEWGVEADYFSFNESDIGIDVLFTPQEHCDFIKEFGAVLAERNLPCKMLLGDNSDATTTWFIEPALADTEAHNYIGAVSFHSWRGCDDATLRWWRDAARSINKPLIVGEGSTDAAAWRYPAIFAEPTFALYEINLYTRLCNICQPLSILQWQLTADYSLLRGGGLFGERGSMRPTQRFFNLKQLALTPANSLAIPVTVDKDNVNVAAMYNLPQGAGAVHIVNNGAACPARVTGLPESATAATVYVANASANSEATLLPVTSGSLDLTLPAESFVTVIVE